MVFRKHLGAGCRNPLHRSALCRRGWLVLCQSVSVLGCLRGISVCERRKWDSLAGWCRGVGVPGSRGAGEPGSRGVGGVGAPVWLCSRLPLLRIERLNRRRSRRHRRAHGLLTEEQIKRRLGLFSAPLASQLLCAHRRTVHQRATEFAHRDCGLF